jgi:hypothetical protein
LALEKICSLFVTGLDEDKVIRCLEQMGDDKVGDVCANGYESDEVPQQDGFGCFREVGNGIRERRACATN